MFNRISPETLFTGQSCQYLPTCHSTNDFALNFISDANAVEGTVIITSNQTAGKGQRGNKWEAEPGKNLTFSVIYKPTLISITDQFYLNIITSLAVCESLTYFLKKKVKVKWPNDIYIDDKKVCGILIQNLIKGKAIANTVIGIGLNVNQEEFIEPKAVSMRQISGNDFDLKEVLERVLEELEKNYLTFKSGRLNFLKEKYLDNLFWKDEERNFRANEELFEGIIREIDDIGRLGVEINNSIKYFEFKEIAYLY